MLSRISGDEIRLEDGAFIYTKHLNTNARRMEKKM